jgi:hypothetical protein
MKNPEHEGCAETEERIAEDLMSYLQANPGVCADVSVGAGNFPWIRFRDGEWQYAKYGEVGKVESRVLNRETVRELFVSNPVNLDPVTEAYKWSPSTETVWEHADQQDAFSDLGRCVWCGYSERTRELAEYRTVEDGECLLCAGCAESWKDAGEIEAPVAGE